MIKIIAISGHSRYLLTDDNGKTGQVLDVNQDMLYPKFKLQSILERGYWQDYTGSQDILNKLLENVKILGEKNLPKAGMD
jgi:hypothetical protein